MFIIDVNNVVIDIAPVITEIEPYIEVTKIDGSLVNYMSADLTIVDKDVDAGVIAQKYIYVNNAFLINPNYVEPSVQN